MRPILSKAAVRVIHRAIDGLFARAKSRILGRRPEPKRLVISVNKGPYAPTIRDDLSFPGVFRVTAAMEGMKPNPQLEDRLMRITEGYLDAYRAKTRVQAVTAVENFLAEAEASGEVGDIQEGLNEHLGEVFGKVTHEVKRLVEAESTRVRNAGSLDAISKANAMAGVDDPVVYFVVINDEHLCSECKRLHLMDDGVTPRVYKLSEVGHRDHKRGDPKPKVQGLHPHCRCTIVTLMPGYGFKGGKVAYIGPDHDELAAQRG